MRPYFSWLILLSGWLLIGGCANDPCATRNCQNGGFCIDGACDCPAGFTGANCELSLDPCDRKDCDPQRSRTCVSDGDLARCVCETGFEGERCQQAWTDKFLKRYRVVESCGGDDQIFFAEVVDGPRFQQLTLNNFHNQASSITSARIVTDLVSSTVGSITDQFMTFGKVDGSVNYLSNGQLALTYTIATDSDTLVCAATYTPE
jgi:hypothetical protein